MLYDFHRHENKKKPKSVNATYIIIGIQSGPEKASANGSNAKDGEDDAMQSSPFMSSMPQQDELDDKPKVTSVTLVQEDDLEG
jgi:DNA polymerase delta subunit 3